MTAPTLAKLRRSLPPEGAISRLGAARRRSYVRPRGVARAAPPEGAHSPWGGPAALVCPHACRFSRAAPEGAHAPWGGPAAQDAPPRLPLRGAAAPEGARFALGRPGGARDEPSHRAVDAPARRRLPRVLRPRARPRLLRQPRVGELLLPLLPGPAALRGRRSTAQNRLAMRARIETGEMEGFLAYDGDEVAGLGERAAVPQAALACARCAFPRRPLPVPRARRRGDRLLCRRARRGGRASPRTARRRDSRLRRSAASRRRRVSLECRRRAATKPHRLLPWPAGDVRRGRIRTSREARRTSPSCASRC